MEFLSPLTPCKSIKNKLNNHLNPSSSSFLYNTPTKISSSSSTSAYILNTPERTSLQTNNTNTLNNNSNTLNSSSNNSNSKRKKFDSSHSNSSNLNIDRFIPNRNKIDFSYCNSNLLFDVGKKENTEESKVIDTKTLNQKKFKEEIFQLTNQTPGKRMLNCFESSITQDVDSSFYSSNDLLKVIKLSDLTNY